MSITSNGSSTSIVTLNTSKNAQARTYTVPIYAKISFPKTVIAHVGGSIFNFSNPISSNITQKTNLTFLVQQDAPPQQVLKNWLEDWFNPLTGTWTTITTISAGILGWRVWSKNRKTTNKHVNTENESSDSKSHSGSPF